MNPDLLPTRFTIKGKPVILKNGKTICFNKKTGRRFVKSNDRVVSWTDTAIKVMHYIFGTNPEKITVPINAKMLFYGAWKRSGETIPDMSNLYQAPEDALQKAGVIADDRQIESHDGSRRICMCDTCDDRPFFKAGPKRGQRKPDCGAVKKCPYERIEIELTEFVDCPDVAEDPKPATQEQKDLFI